MASTTWAFAAFKACWVPSNALPALIIELARGVASLQQGARPIEFLLRQGQLGLQLRDIRLGFQDRMFVLAHQRFLASELGFKIPCIHVEQ